MKKINSTLFKSSVSKFATGVTVITINKNNQYIGKTINSFASLSLDPPLILFSLDKKSTSLKDYMNSKFFGINILSTRQKRLSNHFSSQNPEWNKTKNFLTKNNTPMLCNCLANINCKIFEKISKGDHIIFICKIIEVDIDHNRKPLIYHNSKYI